MTKLIQPGRIIFAVGIIGLGVLQFFVKDFIIARPPEATWAATIPGKLAWAYISGVALIILGLGIIINIKGRSLAIVVGIIILVFSFFFRHLYEMVNWVGAYKALALSGGAFIVASSFTSSIKEETAGLINFFSNKNLLFMGCLFISLFLINCGLAHFKFDDFVVIVPPFFKNALTNEMPARF